MDLFDWLVAVGLLLLGLAVGLAWGWLAVLAYVAVLLIVVGIAGSLFRTRAPNK